jgi:hypothetical protein
MLVTMQGAGKITLMMHHLRTPGQPQEFAIIVLDHGQYNAGVGFHRLEQTQKPLPHLEGVLMPMVQEYLSDIKGLVQIAQATIQPLQQHGNHYIMDLGFCSSLFPQRDIKYINYCWLYLQILTLSDMYNAQGIALVVGIFDSYCSASQSCSVLLEH